jgi:hypothetical protein
MNLDDLSPEALVGEEWAEWYRITPQERFAESMKLWDTYLELFFIVALSFFPAKKNCSEPIRPRA